MVAEARNLKQIRRFQLLADEGVQQEVIGDEGVMLADAPVRDGRGKAHCVGRL
ncbi:hypothetical protein [Azospirillum argentinense]